MSDRNDLFNRIFLALSKHLAVSFLTYVVYILLPSDEAFFTGLWVCLFITNCTAIITGKMNRILERLPKEKTKDSSHKSQ